LVQVTQDGDGFVACSVSGYIWQCNYVRET